MFQINNIISHPHKICILNTVMTVIINSGSMVSVLVNWRQQWKDTENVHTFVLCPKSQVSNAM